MSLTKDTEHLMSSLPCVAPIATSMAWQPTAQSNDSNTAHEEPIGKKNGDGVGQGLGLDSVWAFMQATGVDKKLFDQVRSIVQHLMVDDAEQAKKFAYQLKQIQQVVEAEFLMKFQKMSHELKTITLTVETHTALVQEMQTDAHKIARVEEALTILRTTHYNCICKKSSFPSCLRTVLSWCF